MSKVRSCVLVAGLFCFSAGYLQLRANAMVEPTPAKDTALPVPEVFAPGIISGPANDGSPTFSPDGGTLFFTRSSAHWSIILESHRLKDGWSEPKVASFSGEWSDSSPALSPDGSFLVFVSLRPLTTDSAQAKQSGSAMASHIWRVNRVGSGWSAPVQLPESVNSFQWIFRPSVAADGSIYFTAGVKGKELSLFRSQYQNGAYRNAEPLSFSDGSVKDVDPEIAPDQSFLVFTSKRPRPGDTTHEHLFIVYNQGGVWGSIVPIRYEGDDANGSSEDNDPRFGADHRTVYFSSDRTLAVHFPRTHEQANEDYQRLQTWDNSNSNIWVISLSPVLKEATSSQSKL
jgi:Tol biopolymer transport system component